MTRFLQFLLRIFVIQMVTPNCCKLIVLNVNFSLTASLLAFNTSICATEQDHVGCYYLLSAGSAYGMMVVIQ